MSIKDIFSNIWNTSFGSKYGVMGLKDPAATVEAIEEQSERDVANDYGRKDISSSDNPVGSWLDNALTGDRDFQRQVALQQMQQDFNSAEAAKAFQRQLTIAQNSTKWQAEQLKQLGVNPAWAIAGGGGSSPAITTAPTATSQAGNASISGSQFAGALSTLGQLVITAARLAVQANSPTVKGVFIPKK